jgi:(p)ppGpp synthase/HD superfamily hydrolase
MTARRRWAPRPSNSHATTPSLDVILAIVRTHHPDADPTPIKQAHDEAAFWHAGQTRKSGDPVLTHCLAVAAIVADVGMPPAAVCASLLHDIADTSCPQGRVADHFGQDIAELVSAVRTAELNGIRPSGPTCKTAMSPGRPSREEAVLAIRLADRLHNMRTIAFVAPAKQQRKARETLDVLAPMARAAGLIDVSRELHDLSSAVLQPTPSPYAVASRVLFVLTLLLPTQQRTRWREEWSAELAAHPTRRARTRFTSRVLLGAPRLSMTLRHPICRERQW